MSLDEFGGHHPLTGRWNDYDAGAGTDEILARATYNLERGQLRAAVNELNGLQGLPAKAVKDWLADAKARLLVEQVRSCQKYF